MIKTDYSGYHGNYLNWHFSRTTREYDKNKEYEGNFDKNKFYFKPQLSDPASDYTLGREQRVTPSNYADGVKYMENADSIACEDIRTALQNLHEWNGSLCVKGTMITGEDYDCGTKIQRLRKYNFYSGNYLNWFYETRLNLAKRIMKKAYQNRTDLRLGLMTIRDLRSDDSQVLQDGGEIKAEIKDDGNVGFLQTLKGITPISALHTPLAECLADAGFYFAHRKSWNSNSSETPRNSPITAWCQNNFVIILTDGASFFDADIHLWAAKYICGEDKWDTDTSNDYIKDYDGDGDEFGPLQTRIKGGYLDDVAYYLYKNDIFKDSELPIAKRAAEGEKKQNIKTYTIGFKMDSLLDWFDTNRGLLDKAARQGGGKFLEANDVPSLERAISSVMNSVENISSSYVTASVPVKSSNKSYSDQYAYVTQFYPPAANEELGILEDEGRWIGNLKKYPIDEDGNFQAKPVDEWSGSDSDKVEEGGVRSKMLNKKSSERNIYFGDDLKEFKVENLERTKTGVADDTSHRKLITDIRCGGISGACTNDKAGYYILGDIIHFAPLVVDYGGASGKRIFVGANDGMLHCFDDDGNEKWGYIPDSQLGKLKYLTPEGHNSGSVNKRTYFIDGGRTIFEKPASGNNGSKERLLIFGERRGGSNYYCLNITSPDAPQLKYDFNKVNSITSNANFGESWTNPRVVPIIKDNAEKQVFWIGGGYDSDNQHRYKKNDPNIKPADTDTKGKGVYAVDATTGRIIEGVVDNSGINNCIIDPVSFSPGYSASLQNVNESGDSLDIYKKKEAHSRLYACDMWGRLWGFRQDSDKQSFDEASNIYSHLPGEREGSWGKYSIFSTGDKQRKVFNRPEVILETFTTEKIVDGKTQIHRYQGEYVYFGTGDREHPSSAPDNSDIANQNRFYAIKNMWDTETPITEGTMSGSEKVLIDVTSLQNGSASLKSLDSYSNRGWFIRLVNKGEKVVSYPVAYRGMVFFTTYTPIERTEGANTSTDPDCSGSNALGIARLYALNYKTGEAVLDLNTKGLDENGEETSDPAKIKKTLSISDRSLEIGSGMPGAPSLIFPRNGGTKIMVGVGNKIYTKDLPVRDMTVYYWKEKQ